MKYRLLFQLPGFLFLVISGFVLTSTAQPNDKNELLNLNRQLTQTMILEQDPFFLLSITNETYVEIAPGGVIESREQIINDLWAFASVDSLTTANEQVIFSGSTAVVLNRLQIHGPIQGPLGEIGPVNMITTYNRDSNGKWCVVARAYSICDPQAVSLGLC